MIAGEIKEDEYRIAASVTASTPDPGEYGPLDCGCCLVSVEIDPVGPRLVFMMMRKDAAEHTHETLEDFSSVLP